MSWTSQPSRSVTKTTLSDLLPPTDTRHQHWAGEAVTCADATAASVLQCTHLSSLPLATLNHLPPRWLTLEKTHTHTHTHTRRPHTQTSLIKCAHASTNTHKPRAQVCISLHLVATRARKLRGEGKKKIKKNRLKALIRTWTVTRLVHKLGEIWVGITIWQPAVRHQTSSVISIFSHDSEPCDKQYHAASQSVSPSPGNVAN